MQPLQLMCIHVTVAYVTSALSKRFCLEGFLFWPRMKWNESQKNERGGRGGKKMRVDKLLHET